MKKILQAIGKAFNLTVVTNDEYSKLTASTPTVSEPTKPTSLLNYTKIASMLTEYDNTRIKIATDALGHEDTRSNTFDFYEFKNYMNYVEQLATAKGITLKGISFIKGVYSTETAPDKSLAGYETLMHLPTAMINGKETLIDLPTSTEDAIMSFKNIMASNGYQWRYDSKEDYTAVATKSKEVLTNSIISTQFKVADASSSSSNYGKITPPYA